jgi:hypothetical protein
MSDEYDGFAGDRFTRWCDVNGVASISLERLADGGSRMRYFRADGSEVGADSYPYDAKLTPYTRADGRC